MSASPVEAPGTEPGGPPQKPRNTGSLGRELLALLVVYLAIGLPALLVGWAFRP